MLTYTQTRVIIIIREREMTETHKLDKAGKPYKIERNYSAINYLRQLIAAMMAQIIITKVYNSS